MVSVKLLEWQEITDPDCVSESYRHSNGIGRYFVTSEPEGFVCRGPFGDYATGDGAGNYSAQTLNQAQSFAQADYERRILAAIEE